MTSCMSINALVLYAVNKGHTMKGMSFTTCFKEHEAMESATRKGNEEGSMMGSMLESKRESKKQSAR